MLPGQGYNLGGHARFVNLNVLDPGQQDELQQLAAQQAALQGAAEAYSSLLDLGQEGYSTGIQEGFGVVKDTSAATAALLSAVQKPVGQAAAGGINPYQYQQVLDGLDAATAAELLYQNNTAQLYSLEEQLLAAAAAAAAPQPANGTGLQYVAMERPGMAAVTVHQASIVPPGATVILPLDSAGPVALQSSVQEPLLMNRQQQRQYLQHMSGMPLRTAAQRAANMRPQSGMLTVDGQLADPTALDVATQQYLAAAAGVEALPHSLEMYGNTVTAAIDPRYGKPLGARVNRYTPRTAQIANIAALAGRGRGFMPPGQKRFSSAPLAPSWAGQDWDPKRNVTPPASGRPNSNGTGVFLPHLEQQDDDAKSVVSSACAPSTLTNGNSSRPSSLESMEENAPTGDI